MSSKISKVSLLFPNNVLIYLNYNLIIIKGTFGTISKKIYTNNSNDLFYNIHSINIKYSNKKYNNLILKINNKNYSSYKIIYHNFLYLFKKYINIVSTSFLSILEVWGIGYKVFKKNDNLFLYLGYSHSIIFNVTDKIELKPFEGTYLFITSHLKDKLLLTSSKLKKLRKKDIYKGKGIRFLNENIKLKVGKKD